jgi:2-methylfumaryl-CoA isomerase
MAVAEPGKANQASRKPVSTSRAPSAAPVGPPVGLNTSMDSTPRLPLTGMQVVECASYVAGPTGGLTLAQLGAEVVRIDPLGGGHDHRRWPLAPNGESYYWSSLNKGKRSVAIDLRSPEGQELAVALITAPGPDRGLLIDNVVGRPWLAHDALQIRRNDLIHLRVQGHPDGRPAVDYTVNAGVGVPQITGPEEADVATKPVNHVLPAWDLITGVSVAAGMLAALHDRERTGNGAFIELALSDVALAGVSNLGWLSEADLRGGDRPRHGNHLYGSFASDFATADGHRVMVVALTEGQWKALHKTTGTTKVFEALETALGTDLRQEEERYRHRETIAAILRPWFASRDLDQASAELDRGRVLWGPYRGMADVAAAHRRGAHPVLADIELAEPGEPSNPGVPATPGTSITARSPLRWNGAYGEPGQSPVLGRDTDQVLTEVLGLTAPELAGLHDRDVI